MWRWKCSQPWSTKNTSTSTFIRKPESLLNMFWPLLFPSSGARQTVVAASGFRMNVEVEAFSADHGREHFHLHIHTETRGCNGSLTGLLTMSIIMPKTLWAVSVRQSNKILRLIVASSWVFYLRACHNVFMETFRTLTLGINISEIWNVATNKNPMNLGHGGHAAGTSLYPMSWASLI